MNCTPALEVMLDAEPSDLAGQGTTPLAAHLSACTRCRAVAHRLHGDTRLLAASIVSAEAAGRMPRRAPVWVRWTPVPVGLVAALLLLLAPRTPDAPPNVAVIGRSAEPAVVIPDAVVPPPVVMAAAPVPIRRATRVRAYPAPIPVAAVRINPASQPFALTRADAGPAVMVDPPAGQRVAVMRTSNPKLTVVWLY
jgi:hypothetical protein